MGIKPNYAQLETPLLILVLILIVPSAYTIPELLITHTGALLPYCNVHKLHNTLPPVLQPSGSNTGYPVSPNIGVLIAILVHLIPHHNVPSTSLWNPRTHTIPSECLLSLSNEASHPTIPSVLLCLNDSCYSEVPPRSLPR